MIVFDIEIVRATPPESGQYQAGIEYCQGWEDYTGMGVACLCCYDYNSRRYRVFGEADLLEFAQLVGANGGPLIGFNSHRFDLKLLRAMGWTFPVFTYDILREVWVAMGLDPDTYTEAHSGTSLGSLAELNLGQGKREKGASAPILWQQGHHCRVINYCLEDVRLTRLLLEKILRGERIRVGLNSSVLVRPPIAEHEIRALRRWAGAML